MLINVLDVSWPLAHAGALPVPLGACHGAAQGASSTSSPCPECLGGQLYGSTRLLSFPLTLLGHLQAVRPPPGLGRGLGWWHCRGAAPSWRHGGLWEPGGVHPKIERRDVAEAGSCTWHCRDTELPPALPQPQVPAVTPLLSPRCDAPHASPHGCCRCCARTEPCASHISSGLPLWAMPFPLPSGPGVSREIKHKLPCFCRTPLPGTAPPRRRRCRLPAAALFSGNPLPSPCSQPASSAEAAGGFSCPFQGALPPSDPQRGPSDPSHGDVPIRAPSSVRWR